MGQRDVRVLGEAAFAAGLRCGKRRNHHIAVQNGIGAIGVQTPSFRGNAGAFISADHHGERAGEGGGGCILGVLGDETAAGAVEEYLDFIRRFPINLGASVQDGGLGRGGPFLIGHEGHLDTFRLGGFDIPCAGGHRQCSKG